MFFYKLDLFFPLKIFGIFSAQCLRQQPIIVSDNKVSSEIKSLKIVVIFKMTRNFYHQHINIVIIFQAAVGMIKSSFFSCFFNFFLLLFNLFFIFFSFFDITSVEWCPSAWQLHVVRPPNASVMKCSVHLSYVHV